MKISSSAPATGIAANPPDARLVDLTAGATTRTQRAVVVGLVATLFSFIAPPPASAQSASCITDEFATGTVGPDWNTAYLGDANATTGSVEIVDGRLRVGSDGSELYHGDDNGLFVYQTTQGDFRIEVGVEEIVQDLGGQYRKACLMLRGTTGVDAGIGVRDPRLMACFVPHFPSPDVPALQFDVRFADGGTAVELASTVTEQPSPSRLAFTRRGSTVTVSFSIDDGQTWVEPVGGAGGSVEIELGDTILAGVMVASYETDELFVADFDDFQICHPNTESAFPAGQAPVCDPNKGLDVIYLLDLSESMTATFAEDGGDSSKLDAARDSLDRIHSQLELRQDGTRAALVTFSGVEEDPATNLASSVQVRAPLSANLGDVGTALRSLGDEDVPRLASTPTALALRETLDILQGSGDPERQQVLILVTDGVPNIDDQGRGPDAYALSEINAISLKDEQGVFLPWGEVAWLGRFNGGTETFDAEPLAGAMRALEDLAETSPDLIIYGVAVHGNGVDLGTFKDDLVEYAAHVSGGRSFSASSQAAVSEIADLVLVDLDCGAPGTGTLGDALWNDLNSDGVEDASEPGIGGVTVEIRDSTNNLVATATTDLGGGYLVRDLAPGTYTVTVDTSSLPAGIDVATADADGVDTPHSATVVLAAFEINRDVDFGYRAGAVGGPEPPEVTSCQLDTFDSTLDGWTVTALGGADQGGAELIDGRLQLSSNGTSMWDDDRAHFAYRTASGDFRVEVDVEDLIAGPGGASFRKAGLMIRGGFDIRSPRIIVQYIPNLPNPPGPAGPIIQFGYRAFDGQRGQSLSFVHAPVDLPVRLAIERRGSTYSAWFSLDDGQTWQQQTRGWEEGAVDLDLGEEVYVGLAVASYDAATPMTLAFDDFAICSPRAELPPPPPTPTCEGNRPLDVIYLMDLSGSMTGGFSGSTDRIEAARNAFTRLGTVLSNRGDGSRAALLTFAGNDDVGHNLNQGFQLLSGLSSDFGALATVLSQVDSSDTSADATTTTSLGLHGAANLLADGLAPGHRPIVVLLTDELPNIDIAGLGPYIAEGSASPVSLLDDSGAFIAPGQVAWQGDFVGAYGAFEGEPVAQAMAQVHQLRSVVPELQIFAVALQDDPAPQVPTELSNLLAFLGSQTGAGALTASTTDELLGAVDAVYGQASCGAPLIPDFSPPTILWLAPEQGVCLRAEASHTLTGIYSEPYPSTGEDDTPPALVVQLVTSDGGGQTFVPAITSETGAFTIPSLSFGSASGIATVVATGTDTSGNVATVGRSWTIDAETPTLSILLDGQTFVGAGPGASPPAGSQPVLFGRQVSLTASVSDGPGAQPEASLTLNGQPYLPGSPVQVDGDYVLIARTIDCAGREVIAHAFFRIDRTPPRLISSNPAEGAALTTGIGNFSGSSDPDLESALVDGEPATVTASGGTSSFVRAPYPWQEGDNTVDIELVDQAGNRATFRRTFTVTSSDLSLEILEQGLPITGGQVFTRAVSPTAVATDGDATITLNRNGQATANGAEITQSGTYNMAAQAVDAEGRVANSNVSFTVDIGGGPQLTVTYPLDTTKVSVNPITVTGTVTGGTPPITVTVNDLPASVNNGNWSVSVPLISGDLNYLTAVATDSRGRRDVVPVSIIHQEGAPTILIFDPVDGTITNRDRIDVVGSVVLDPADLADRTVVVTGPGGQLVADVGPDGSFRAVDMPLVVGDNALVASVTDIHGNVGQATVNVFSDGQPPQISVTANGRVLVDGAVFGQPVQLTVTLTDDSGEVAESVLRLNGEQQAAGGETTELLVSDDGGYLLTVIGRDRAGNEARLERSFVLDRGGCGLADIEPADGTAVTSASITLTGKSGQAVGVEIRVAGQTYPAQLADGTFLAADVPLAPGINSIDIFCQDAGGAGTPQTIQVERLTDGSGPVVQIQTPIDGNLFADDPVDVSGTSTAPTVTVNGLGANFFQGSFGFSDMPLSEGPNILGARAVDASGRIGTDRVVVHLDSLAPVISITSPDNQARVGIAGSAPATIDVTGLVDVSKEPNLDRVTVSTSVEGTAVGTVTASVDPSTGRFVALAVPLDETATTEQAQTITATAYDTLGHESSATAAIFLDATGPAILLTAPDDLTRFGESAPAEVPIRGEAWAEDGGQVRLNGQTVDPALLTWSEPAEDGRRHVVFESLLPIADTDGAFGLIAQVTQPDERFAETRRLLFKDSRAPEVVEMIPADGEPGVEPNALLLVLFSEPVVPASLTGAGGLTLVRQSTGQAVVTSITQAGNAVGVAPGTALARGEIYTLRAGLGIRDAAGNVLASVAESRFTIAEEAAAQAPTVDALPSVVCAPEILVTGTAAAHAQILVRDGTLTFRGFADAAGAFSVSLPVSANGFHVLRVTALDASGTATSSETTLVVQVDCSSPLVSDSAFDRTTGILTVTFSEAVDPATVTLGQDSDGIRLRDAEDPDSPLQTAAISFVGPAVVALQLSTDPTAFWQDRPVRLQVSAPVADGEGNAMSQTYETVFFPGGDDLSGGFLFGEVYDDRTGRPLGSSRVRLFDAGSGLPGTAPEAELPAARIDVSTEGRGRYTMAGSVPAARYAVVAEKSGYTRVVRRLALEPSTGAVPFDSRLTPLAPAMGELDPAAAGSLSTFAPRPTAIEADAGALPGTDPLTLTVTALTGQGLPDFLPLGWTPAAAADLRLQAGGTALLDGTAAAFADGGVRLDLPLDTWVDGSDTLVAVQYLLGAGIWTVLDDPLVLTGDVIGLPVDRRVARLSPVGPGAVAVIVPDTDPAYAPTLPSTGEILTGVDRPEQTPTFEADLQLEPAIITPTGKSQARVVARSADGSTAWPSGLAVQAFLEESLILAAGQGQLLEAPFAADLVLYQPRLSTDEQSGNALGSAGAGDFVISPSPRAAQVLLEVGYEDVRIYPFPETVERGPVVGPTGGTVGQGDDVELVIPEGAVSAETIATAEVVPLDDLNAGIAQWPGYTTLAAVRLDFQGKVLGRAATLRLPVPDGTPAEVAGDPRLLLVEILEAPDDLRAAFPKLTARSRRQGTGSQARVIAGPDSNGGLPLEGLVREGLYLLLHADVPVGFATGTVSMGNGVGLDRSRVTVGVLGTADLTSGGGRYSMPVPAGDARTLQAVHPDTDEIGQAVATVAAGQMVTVDITLVPTPPTIVALTPLNGAVDQPTLVTVAVQWNEALDPSSVSPSSLRIELADAAGNGTGLFANGEAKLTADGASVYFDLDRPLAPGRRWVASFHGGVRDLRGAGYAGPVPVQWGFSTSTIVSPGGQVDASRFHIEVPVNGVARIFADADAIPRAQLGQIPWLVVPYAITRRGLDPVSVQYPATLNGSFDGTIGTAGYPVDLGTEVWVKVLDPQGQIAAEFRVGPFVSPDGKGFVASAGEALTFRSAEGVLVDVPASAFDQATLVRVEMLPISSIGLPTPEGLQAGAFVRLDFDGEANETLRLSVPAPAEAEVGDQVFVGEKVNVAWGRRMQMLTYGAVLERGGEKLMSNDATVQPEPAAGSNLLTPSDGQEKSGGTALGLDTEGVAAASKTAGTCFGAQQQGKECLAAQLLGEFRRRSDAAWYFEQGADWALISGPAAPFALGVGAGNEVIANAIADLFVFIPVPRDSKGGIFLLPVIGDQPLVIQRRDAATGWVLSEQAYDPVSQNGGPVDIATVDPLAGGEPSAPMLVSAGPFQFLRFSAPPPESKDRLRLEIEVETDENGLVTMKGMEDYELPALSSLQIYDLEPLTPKEEDEEPMAPKEGPKVRLCDDSDDWQIPSFKGTQDMLVVISPGDLQPADARTFTFQFDRTLKDLEDTPVQQIGKLEDLGPANGCSQGSPTGYPRDVPMLLTQEDQGRRLVLEAANTLPGGHRFRLRIQPEKLITEGVDPQRPYWGSAPKQFEFATRGIEGDTVGSFAGEDFPFGGTASARDMLRFGNLLVVGSDTGRILAVDTRDMTGEGKFELHAISAGTNPGIRTFATDGHNRIFYHSLFGGLWAIKTLRIEDIRKGEADCPSPSNTPSWTHGVKCFNNLKGAARISYMPGTAGLSGGEFLALGGLPSGMPSDLEILSQDEIGKTLELSTFFKAYKDAELSTIEPDDEGFYTFDLNLITTYQRGLGGQLEPSYKDDPKATPPAIPEYRSQTCDGEDDWDRYQRVTVDNLTTGQSWSLDIENPWTDDENSVGNGQETLEGLRARFGDQLRVRYNLRALGYVAIVGGGISVIDLNRGYRLIKPFNRIQQLHQCGRRLGHYAGTSIDFPACSEFGSGPEGILYTPAVAPQSQTGDCSEETENPDDFPLLPPFLDPNNPDDPDTDEEGLKCRGKGRIDLYSPLLRVGIVHTTSGGGEDDLLGKAAAGCEPGVGQ